MSAIFSKIKSIWAEFVNFSFVDFDRGIYSF